MKVHSVFTITDIAAIPFCDLKLREEDSKLQNSNSNKQSESFCSESESEFVLQIDIRRLLMCAHVTELHGHGCRHDSFD